MMPPALLPSLALLLALDSAPAQQSEEPLERAPGAPPRTAVNDKVGTDPEAQYFFLHDDNFFALQTNDEWPMRVKFQFSLRFEALSLGGDENNFALNIAYTQKSFWELFDTDASEPIIENNYRPEGFISWRPRRLERFREVQLGYQHESNGLGIVGMVDNKDLSRGWNYVFVDGKWGIRRANPANAWIFVTPGLRAWVPFVSSPGVVDGLGYFCAYADVDFNFPGIDWLGRVSTRTKVQWHSVQADLQYPALRILTGKRLRTWFYLQYFYGRGERLLTTGVTESHFYVGLGFQ
jgi:outer membrane phospholipase A